MTLQIRRITTSELAVGQPLQWDVHGESGGLLVKRGHVVASDTQMDLLLERGFIEVDDGSVPSTCQEPPSTLRMLNLARAQLHVALVDILNGQATVREKLDDVVALIADAIDVDQDVALACILLNQDVGEYATRHSVDTAVVAMVMARALKMPPERVASVALAALTMNVGMLQHHERFQHTAAPLAGADLAYLRGHPQAGVALLRAAGVDDEDWLACVLQHHENEDGTGYPHGKTSAQIGVAAKIVMLADRYCARVSARSYRKAMLPNAALRDILLEGKETVDAQLASVLLRELGIYPIGTFVKLLSGEIGIVTRKGLNSTTPHVLSLINPWGGKLDVPLRRDTKIDRHAIREVLGGDQAALSFRLDQLWGRSASV
ncbi:MULTISPECIES: HD-GYP domain-containing protein [unclassified Janthinobacterium]|uniref:HD-GYP domain-containing protein n=1 Tax=unclassified Janthinobacterium TaxID=2610881 RepID=UPI00034A8B92|nr:MULTISPECIES: HD domain-containing phosphohydrolase [unclassified Janthinobacterium]MEC5162838.1 HD-GYP domain-containing protein (c-di-GMP phosphodiesterase class II) [Janthinobacterium sp. CG_S6]